MNRALFIACSKLGIPGDDGALDAYDPKAKERLSRMLEKELKKAK